MLKNIWKTAIRNLVHDRLYSGVNIGGLIIGITSCLFIALYLVDEFSYDRYHSEADRTYRLWEILELEGTGEESSSMQFPVAPALINDYPHLIDEAVRFFNFQRPVFTLQVEDQVFNQEDVFFVDSGVFRVFDWPLISGDPQTIMAQPNTIVIDEDLAKKYFGDEDPLGQQMAFEGVSQLTVGGVMRNVPEQSHFRPKALISFITLRNFLGPNISANNWVWNPCWTYVKLSEGISPQEFENQMGPFIEKYYPDFLKNQTSFYLMPLTDVHLESHLEYEIQPNQQRSYLYILGGIGLIILLIASVNFTNLATARAIRRAREVGIRKVSGASRAQLVFQFLFESLLSVLIAVLVSMLLVNVLMQGFNALSNKGLEFSSLLTPDFMILTVGILLFVTLLAGMYPAFYLSSFEPSHVLKGGGQQPGARVTVRKVLVVLQFTLASALVISTLMVNRQFTFLQSEDPGFAEDEVIVISTKPTMMQQFLAFRTQVLSSDAIESFTVMNDILGEDHNVFEYNYDGMDPDAWQYLPSLIVDEHFVETMGLEIIAGRDFNEEIASDDTAAVLVNQTLVREMGWGDPQDAIGKRMDTPRGSERVAGVLKDFHYVGLDQPIKPFVLDMIKTQGFWIQEFAVRIKSGSDREAVQHLEAVWNEFAPQYPFEYFFLEERLDQLYKGQDILRVLVMLFSIVAILISCIGLFALTSLSVVQRTKEIGIRKILGAEAGNLAWLISKEVFTLIIIAFVIGVPVAFWAVQDWLQSFAYHISFEWGTLIIAALISIIVAGLTVAYHAVKVGRTDPVHSLKYE